MATERRDDLKAFHDFVGEQLANGGASLTPAETLDLWEIQHPSDEEQAATVEALRKRRTICGPGTWAFPHASFLPKFAANTTCRLGHELSRKHPCPGESGLAAGVNDEGRAIGVLLVAELGIEFPLSIKDPVEAAELLVSHDPIEEVDPVAGVPHIFVVMGSGILSECCGRPGHPGLVDQRDVVIRLERPVAGHILMEPASLPVHGMRVPVLGQLLGEESSILRPSAEVS